MSRLESIAHGISLCVSDMASLAKVAIRSKKGSRQRPVDPSRAIIILGNGPSLRGAIDHDREVLDAFPLMGVNFFANTPDFNLLKPEYYILADGHFFDGRKSDPNVERLWRSIAGADWEMTLFVPANQLARVGEWLAGKGVRLRSFNLTPVEGHSAVTHALIRRGLGMPRPRNVLIPAIMTALADGFGRIYLAGADHSWSKTLSVDSRNRVLSRQPHFYEDNEKELDRVAAEYAGYHLHDILLSLTIAFRSYHHILDYSRSIGAEIINVTPDSMIDAFPRAQLSEIQTSK